MVRTLVLIGLGDTIGSILRYLTSVFVIKYFHSATYWGTFAVNIIGCLFIGLLLGFIEKHQISNPNLGFFFLTGFCGGYTTFSTFALENLRLFQTGNPTTAFFYIAISVITGLLAVWVGLTLAR